MTHGTMRGYIRHLKRGEPTCPECRAANAAKSRDYWRKHHPAPNTITRRIIAVVDTHQPVHQTELAALIPDTNPETLRRTVHRLRRDGRLVGDTTRLETP